MRDTLQALGDWAQIRPTAPATDAPDATLTYGELARVVGGMCRVYEGLPACVGIFAEHGSLTTAADLALSYLGKTVVPLPTFFSDDQLRHIIDDSGLGHILTSPDLEFRAEAFDIPHSLIETADAPLGDTPAISQRIIYTSGTTGAPKGVRHTARQIDASARALFDAVKPGTEDVYLSVLPYALLLEQICSIAVPILAGARLHIVPDAARACAQGNPTVLLDAAARVEPTVSVLVPDLLKAWVAGLQASERKAPNSLRFVAVGGASVPVDLAEAGWALGLPVHEGYGLSECCSVVAVNRSGARVAGTVGKPLAGVNVDIVDGEIVVTAPTVMDGYLGREDVGDTWPTGDGGHFDADGNLVVEGRLDSRLILPDGRNIDPQWIEALLMADPRISLAVLGNSESHGLVVLLLPSAAGERFFEEASHVDVAILIDDLLGDVPGYAQPGKFHVCVPEIFDGIGGVGLNGAVNRTIVPKLIERALS